MDTEQLIADLRQAIEKATSGKWDAGIRNGRTPFVGHAIGAPICTMDERPGLPGKEEADRDYIVLAQPANIRLLLDSIATLRSGLLSTAQWLESNQLPEFAAELRRLGKGDETNG